MFHPIREGVRGGRDQFSWEAVKEDKHRENYLGHSIRAPVGRWQKGRDILWYTKPEKEKIAAADAKLKQLELQKIKEQEAEAMAVCLGYKKALTSTGVSMSELKQVLQKEQQGLKQEEQVEAVNIANLTVEANSVKGLGYKASGRYLPGQVSSNKAPEKSSKSKHASSLDDTGGGGGGGGGGSNTKKRKKNDFLDGGKSSRR